MNNNEIFIAILIMSIISYFIRALPFLFFRNKELPSCFLFIGKYFPSVVIAVLIIYTLKDVNFLLMPYGLKEICSIIFTGILHLIFKNYLISIFFGTILYMGLVQLV